MKKRILCGLLTVLLIVQSVPLQTYASESLSEVIAEENSLTEDDMNSEMKEEITEDTFESSTEMEINVDGEETVMPVETEEPTVTPEEGTFPEVKETEKPTAIPDEAIESQEMIVLPSECPIVTPSVEPSVTPEELIEIEAEMTTEDEVPELTLDEEYTVTIENVGDTKWLKFTALDAGEYIFYNIMGHHIKSGLYKNISDTEPIAIGNSLSDIYGWYALYELAENETIYWNIGYSDLYTGNFDVNIRRKGDFKGIFSEPKVTSIPYGFEIQIDFMIDQYEEYNVIHNYGVNDAYMTLAYSTNPNADFHALNSWVKYYDEEQIGELPEDIKITTFEKNGSNGYQGVNLSEVIFLASPVDDYDLLPDTTYYYTIFCNVETEDEDGYCLREVCKGTAVTGTGIEKSKVAVANEAFTIETGYARMHLTSAVTNPDREAIVECGFKLQAEGSDEIVYKMADNFRKGEFEYNGTFGMHDTYTVTPYAKVREGVSLIELCGETKTVTRKNLTELENLFTVTSSSRGGNVSYDFMLGNKADDNLVAKVECINEAGKIEYETIEDITITYWHKDGNWFGGMFEITEEVLAPDVTYHIVITLYDDWDFTKVIYTQEATMTPDEVITYSEADFPDPVFRALLAAELDGEVFTSDNLETIQDLSLDSDMIEEYLGEEQAIKSIEGIQYLSNLQRLYLIGQDISDISCISTLKNLSRITLTDNEIKEIPDLSQLSMLKHLDLEGNLIPETEFLEKKFHANFLAKNSSVIDAQRKENKINISDYYYRDINGNVDFYIEIDGIKRYRNWNVSLSINGKEYTIPLYATKDNEEYNQYERYNQYSLEINDLPCGSYEATVLAQEKYNGRTIEISKKIEIKDAEVVVPYQKYIDNINNTLYVNTFIPYSAANEKITSIKLTDMNNNLIGTTDGKLADNIYITNVIKADFMDTTYRLNGCFWNVIAEFELGNYNLSGDYNVVVETTEDTYVIEKYATTDYKEPLVTQATWSNGYDNSGEYFYMLVRGEGLDFDKFYPVLLTEDGKEITEYVDCWVAESGLSSYYYPFYSPNSAVYKLKKLDGFVDNVDVPFKFVSKAGYPEVKYIRECFIQTFSSEFIVDLVYNTKTNEYILYAPYEFPIGTEIEFGLTDKQPYSQGGDYYGEEWEYKYDTLYATATVIISGAENKVEFKDAEGELFKCDCDKEYYYGAEWKIKHVDGHTTVHDYGTIKYTDSGFFDSYDNVAVPVYYSGECYQNVGKTITTEFTTTESDTSGGDTTATITLAKYDDTQKSYVNLANAEATSKIDSVTQKTIYEAIFTSDTNYTAGMYQVTFVDQKGVEVQKIIRLFEDEKIYQISQNEQQYWDTSNSKLNLNIGIVSNSEIDQNKFSFEFYDINKEKITDWTLYSVTQNDSNEADYSYWTFAFDGLPGKYRYIYAKVLYDGKVMADINNPEVSYYEAKGYADDYGESFSLFNHVTFSYSTDVGYDSVLSEFTNDYTVEIYTDEHADFITRFNVPSSGKFVFTKELLKDVLEIDPELNNLYTLIAKKNGLILASERYVNIGYSETEVSEVTLDKTSEVLNIGETLQLTATITPDNATMKSVTWSSSEQTVASVDENGLITAISQGDAVITVITNNGKTAECKVKVLDKFKVPDTTEHMVYALTNKDKTLADISDQLLPGFTFNNPEINLSTFAGASEKCFAVTYTDKYGRTAQTIQNVNLLTIKGINAVADTKTLKADGSNKAVLLVEALWNGYDGDESIKAKMLEDYHFEVATNKADRVTIAEEDGKYVITGKNKGEVVLTILLRSNGTDGDEGVLYKKTLGMTVVSQMADIQLEVTGAEYDVEGEYYYVTDIKKAAISLKAVAKGYKLTWKASDTGVAQIGKAKNNISTVTLKNNGKVKLTVTANDTGKTSKSIMLYVMDVKPSIDTSVSVNKATEIGGTLGIYGSYGYDIQKYDVQLMKKADVTQKEENFAISYNAEQDVYEITVLNNTAITTGKYPVVVKVTAQTELGDKEYLENVIITVTDKAAAYSVKQSKKVNLFYADATGNGKLSLTSKKAVVESVTLSDCDFSYDYQTGELQFTGKDYKNADKSGILNIKFMGYHEVKKNITIKTEVKKPGVSVSASSSTLYPNADIVKAQLQLKNKNTGEVLSVEAKNITQSNLSKDAYQIYAEDGQIVLRLKDGITVYPKTAKIKVALQMENWNEAVSFTHTVKSNKTQNVKLKLSVNKITINKNETIACYQKADIKVRAQGATESDRIQSVTVSGTDKKSIDVMNVGLVFDFDSASGILSAGISNHEKLDKTTYAFNVRAELSEGKYATAKLKVTIVDKAPESLLSVTCKGSIDVFDRENSYVTCTPKVKNLSGTITGVSLNGRDAYLFEAEMNESGKTIIKAKEGVAYITKYAYKVQPVYEISSGDRTYTVAAKTLSLKLKQTKPNLTAALSSKYLYQASDNKLNVSVTALNSKGKGLQVRDIELVETKAVKGAFEVKYNEEVDSYQLSVKDVSKVKKGKTYKLKLNVYLNEQADNEKAGTVTVSITVK